MKRESERVRERERIKRVWCGAGSGWRVKRTAIRLRDYALSVGAQLDHLTTRHVVTIFLGQIL